MRRNRWCAAAVLGAFGCLLGALFSHSRMDAFGWLLAAIGFGLMAELLKTDHAPELE